MPDNLVEVISYLTLSELNSMKSRLDGARIKYVVNGHGAVSKYSSQHYAIRVSQEDYRNAKSIADKFRASKFVESRQCPTCESPNYELLTGLNFFQKLLYLGTTPVRCKKCKKIYGV